MLRTYVTGIRSGEYITSAPDAPQNKGTVAQIRGLYPPSLSAVEALELTDRRDKLTKLDFFKDMNEKDIDKWLREHAVKNDDLYIEDIPGLEIRFIALSGTAVKDRLTNEQVGELLDGEYRLLTDVSRLFDKPGSK